MTVDPYASGVLEPETHARLVLDIENYARDAGVQPRWIWTALAETVGKAEVEYVRQYKSHGQADGVKGMCCVRKDDHCDPATRMAAIAGALVRNFIRARVMTLGVVLDMLATRDTPDATCLLIPNFFQAKAEGGSIAPWQIGALFDLLLQRSQTGSQTIVYVTDMKALSTEYGVAFADLFTDHYLTVSI